MSSEEKKDFIVIGVTGEPSAGKDYFAEYIESKGFPHISLGDYLRKEAPKHGFSLDRPGLSAFVSKIRMERGYQYPVDEVSENIKGDTILSGFRNRKESEFLKNKFGSRFVFVGVTARPEIRYERMKKRGRIGDNLSFDEFQRQDIEDRKNATGTHEVDKVVESADYKIDNSGGEEEFKKKIDEWFLENISSLNK